MSKAGTSAPKAIDPTALANAQTAANITTANNQSILNNNNTTSPFGTSLFTQQPSGQWDLNQTLTPALQDLFTNQSTLGNTLAVQAQGVAPWAGSSAQAGASTVNDAFNNIEPTAAATPAPTLQKSLDYSTLGPLAPSDYGPEVTSAQNAAYKTQSGYLDPQYSQKHSDLNTLLANEGIQPGTEAYSRAQGDLGRQEDLAYQGAQNAAVSAGNAEQYALAGEKLNSQTLGANNILNAGEFGNKTAQQLWQDPLTALGSLSATGENILGGTSSNLAALGPLANFNWGGSIPTFGSNGTVVPASNVVGAGQVGATSANNAFNAGNTLNNSLFNGLGSLAGATTNGNLLSSTGALFGNNGIFSAGGLLGSQGALFGTAADASIAGGGPPLALAALA
jgi:hypothetical protein